ncbi:LOW QUALITY PROTEIN: hypothetical protein Cgig2_017233 [Carnegiea gigantea]|uniref:Uncharacterized protein n=1 Tax=Carnegiea gigantea TaxID=171969 RepID=A0A9Q1JM42_9CARY|nr:LOW QUALITY PROTEIN: hypothetical protein Cgig2_017233 [Carnegiea gigantea]
MAPVMVFDGCRGPYFTSPHNNPLMVELKVASTLVRQILIDSKSSVDIITWDYLKKLKHLGREIIPLVHPILGFAGQEVNPAGMIRLLLRFGDKGKARNPEVDFLVVDVPTAYNVILGGPTLHKGEGLAIDMAWLAKGRKNGKKERSRGRRSLTSAMATCSSVTLGGSEELEGAKSYDLARRFTRVDVVGSLQKIHGLSRYIHRGLPNCWLGNTLAPSRASFRRRPHCRFRGHPFLERRSSKLGEEYHKGKTQSTIGLILKYKKAGGNKKEYDNLGSQFRGFLPLDLDLRRSGSFPASASLDIKDESGFRWSSSRIFLFNGHNKPLLFVKIIPTNIPGFTWGLLNGMNQSKGPSRTR